MVNKAHEVRIGTTLLCSGTCAMIPGTDHKVRQCTIDTSPFAAEPTVTVTLYSNDSAVPPFVVTGITKALQATGASIKVTAQAAFNQPAPTAFLCDYVIVGESAPQSGNSRFGEWTHRDETGQPYALGVTYPARTDGFVSAASGGNVPAEHPVVLSGPSPGALVERARGAAAYGSVCVPVRAGDYWQVGRWNSSVGATVEISWLAVV